MVAARNEPLPPRLQAHIGDVEIELISGDLATMALDAIVCPANNFLHMRGGLARHLRVEGGESIEKEAMRSGILDAGSAILTAAGRLPCKFIIHAPTVYRPMDTASASSVALATRAALECAAMKGLTSIGIPALGTGTGAVSFEESARSILSQVRRVLGRGLTSLSRIVIVAYEGGFYDAVASNWELLTIEGRSPGRL